MNLKFYRKKMNKTQGDIAKVINVAPTTYLGYEKETSEPNIETLIKLADYYNISVDSLIGHNMENFVDISLLTDSQKELINKIINCNDKTCDKLLSYLDGLKSKD